MSIPVITGVVDDDGAVSGPFHGGYVRRFEDDDADAFTWACDRTTFEFRGVARAVRKFVLASERMWFKLGFVAGPAGRQNVVMRKSASSGATDVKAPTADAMSQSFDGDVAHDRMKELESRLDSGAVRMIVRDLRDGVGVVCAWR